MHILTTDVMESKYKNKLIESWYEKFNRQLKGFMGKSVKHNIDLQDMSQGRKKYIYEC